MQIPVRNFGDVLNEGVRSLGKVWRQVLPPAFAAFAVLGAVTAFVARETGASAALDLLLSEPDVIAELSDDVITAALLDLVNAFLIAGTVQALVSAFVSLIGHRAVAAHLAGHPMTAGQLTAFAARRFPALLIASLIVIIGVAVGMLLLIVPGIWLAGRFSMVSPVIAIEETGSIAALRRSSALVRGRWWPTVGFVITIALLGSVAIQLVQLIAVPLLVGGVPLGLGLTFVAGILMQAFVAAAIAVVLTAWYLDLRARQEVLLTENLV